MKAKKQLGLFERAEKGREVAQPSKAPEAKQPLITVGLTPEAERLLANFEVVAEAPGGVKRLRELILELAVRGRLVAQDSRNESATNLLSRILVKRAEELGPRAIPQKPPDGLPALTNGWCWASLDALLVYLRNGIATAPVGDSGVPILRISAVRPNQINVAELRFLPGVLSDYAGFEIAEGDLLFTRYSGNADYVGICGVVPKLSRPTVHPDKLIRGIVCPGLLEPRYVALAVNVGESRRRIDECARTTAGQVGISGKQLKGIPVPLPPLAEQKRIVAKVDELMKLCDDLEARQAKQRETAGRLNKAALDALTSAEGPEELAASWRRVAGSFDALLNRPESVKELRASVLELAVRGRLVNQESEDEPAAELLKRMESERQALASNKKSRNELAEAPPAAPFTLPSLWSWSYLSTIFRTITDGDHLPPPKAAAGVAFLTIGNISSGTIDFRGSRFVPQKYYDSLAEERVPRKGDLLYTVVGSYGKAIIVDVDREFCVQRHIAIMKPLSMTNVKFASYLMQSGFVLRQATTVVTGIAQPTIGLGVLRKFVIPVPPLAEQKRIVAKVDELMKLCDALADALRRAEDTAKNLADALVAELLA